MPKSLFPLAAPETRARLEQSETLRLINEFDWTATPLGPIPDWPESLKGAVRVLVSSSTPMVMLVGEEGHLIYNDAYADFAGRRHPDIFGRPVVEAWPEIADFNRHKLALGFAGESLLLRDQELVLDRHGQMESGWMDLHYSPVLGEDGEPQAVLCIVHETTDRVMAEQALARSEERLSLALSGSGLVGTWDWDILEDRVTADDKYAELYNLDSLRAGLGVPFQRFMEAIHPDDRDRLRADIDAALAEGDEYRSQYRVIGQDGVARWVVASGRVRRDREGRAVRLPGVLVDISEQKAAADALAESEARFRTLADTMPQMVWSTGPDGHYDYFNARWYEFTGLPAGTRDGEALGAVIHPEDFETVRAAWARSRETGEPYQIEYRLRHHDGQYRWALVLALPMRDEAGRIVRWFGTCTDIHDTRIAAEERELVAQELSHRIKNIFAVVTGIISLSARSSPEVKPFADQLRERVHALGEAHDFVRPHSSGSSAGGEQTSLKALMRRLLEPYDDGAESRVVFAGEDAEIDEGAATPLALLVHELATNSAKYGALSSPEGRIALEGHMEGAIYKLDWKEKGGPELSGPADGVGFGSRLMALSVEGQMRGSIERRWEADGLRLVVALPGESLRKSARIQPAG